MRFTMPFGKYLEIIPNKEIDELEIGMNEQVEGIFYSIFWDKKECPFIFETRATATAMALGIQFGASHIIDR